MRSQRLPFSEITRNSPLFGISNPWAHAVSAPGFSKFPWGRRLTWAETRSLAAQRNARISRDFAFMFVLSLNIRPATVAELVRVPLGSAANRNSQEFRYTADQRTQNHI